MKKWRNDRHAKPPVLESTFNTLRLGLIGFGMVLVLTTNATAQDKDWNILSAPWDQAKQMVCTEVRRDACTLRGSCGPSHGQAKFTFDFAANRIDFGNLEVRITGRTFRARLKTDPTIALLMGDGRLFKLQYTLNDPDRGMTTVDPSGQLVVRRSKDDVRFVEPKAQLTGFMVGYDSYDSIGKEGKIEVTKFECSKKDPGPLDFLKR